mmetsp:Transcript_25091/g.63700  ORF Transcript_25091/g.63700 Transcript_25091/m.63700 type:complete len:244 (-) Transcript_25091:213-944(-)
MQCRWQTKTVSVSRQTTVHSISSRRWLQCQAELSCVSEEPVRKDCALPGCSSSRIRPTRSQGPTTYEELSHTAVLRAEDTGDDCGGCRAEIRPAALAPLLDGPKLKFELPPKGDKNTFYPPCATSRKLPTSNFQFLYEVLVDSIQHVIHFILRLTATLPARHFRVEEERRDILPLEPNLEVARAARIANTHHLHAAPESRADFSRERVKIAVVPSATAVLNLHDTTTRRIAASHARGGHTRAA